MMKGKVWIVFAVVVLLATIVTSKELSGVEKDSTTRWPNSVGGSPLTGPSNQSEFGGNWKYPLQDSTWHSKTPSKIGINFPLLPRKGSTDVHKKMVGLTKISQTLFTNPTSVKIRTMALNSKFIDEMALGKLSPVLFNRYLAKDAFYFARVAGLYRNAASLVRQIDNAEEFELFYLRQGEKFAQLHHDIITTMEIREITEDEEGVALRMYIDFLESVISEGRDPRLLPIAMLPCSMLYPYLAKAANIRNLENNPYNEGWFQKNTRDSETSTEIFVNDNPFIAQIDLDVLMEIFLNGMLHECNFFRESHNEILLKSIKEI